MALRMLRYTERVLSVLHSNETLRGPARADVRPAQRPAAMAQTVDGLEVRHGYQVLDLLRSFAQDLLSEDSLLNWLAALERDPWPNFPHVHRAMADRWGGADCLAARQAFAKWVVERMEAPDVPDEVLDEIKERIEQPTEAEEMGQTYTEWVESHRQQGRTEGGATMLVRMASRRFGAETAEKLAGLVRAMGGEQLARVGDAVVDCDTGDELLAAASNGATEGG